MDTMPESKEPSTVAEDDQLKEKEANPGPIADVVEEDNAHAPSEEKEEPFAPSKVSVSPPRRPLTRSQTGTVTKRRPRDDSDHIGETKKRTSAPRKKQKTSTPSTSNAPGQDTSSTPSPSDSAQSPTRDVSLASSTLASSTPSPSAVEPNASASATGHQITFYHAPSLTSEDGQQLQPELSRLPRSRATLPTPIPNLTKKSRGRRVPTQDVALNDPDRKDHRLYVCTVDGCGKCFHRGEHLKRHIRSIHTHEKPFKCTFPLCQKYFNRHDNLLQHLKVHREMAPKEASAQENQKQHISAPPPQRYSAPSQSSSSTSPPAVYHRRHSYSPVRMPEPESPAAPTVPRTIYNAFPRAPMVSMATTYSSYPSSVAFSAATNSISLLAEMAVSSLRTELPQSSLDSRTSALRSNPY